MSLNDPEAVRAEYASEQGLTGRMSVYRFADGPLRVRRAPVVFVAET